MPLGMEVGLGPGNFVLDGDPAPLPKKRVKPPPIFGACLLWPNSRMDQDGTWHGGGPWSRPHYARWGPSFFAQKGVEPKMFSHLYCGQTAVCIRIPIGTEVGLSLEDIVLDGDPAPPPLKGHSPPFSANVGCGQTARRTKMPFGMEVGLHPGDFVFDGDTAPTPEKKAQPRTQFLAHVYCGQTAGWIKMPLGTEVNLGPGDVVLDGVAAPP